MNSRFDLSTPPPGAYAGAQVMVIEGAGHSSMYVSSTCAEQVKREYLFSGELPPEGTGCGIDGSPFG